MFYVKPVYPKPIFVLAQNQNKKKLIFFASFICGSLRFFKLKVNSAWQTNEKQNIYEESNLEIKL
jgi:hypothetical protein